MVRCIGFREDPRAHQNNNKENLMRKNYSMHVGHRALNSSSITYLCCLSPPQRMWSPLKCVAREFGTQPRKTWEHGLITSPQRSPIKGKGKTWKGSTILDLLLVKLEKGIDFRTMLLSMCIPLFLAFIFFLQT